MTGASLPAARAAKARLTEEVGGHPDVSGIGLARAVEGYRVQVRLARDGPVGLDVPAEVDGVAIDVVVVGRVVPRLVE